MKIFNFHAAHPKISYQMPFNWGNLPMHIKANIVLCQQNDHYVKIHSHIELPSRIEN